MLSLHELDPGYTAEVDCTDRHSWHSWFPEFKDASFYQTWSYGTIRWDEKNLSHLILKKNGTIVSLAQLRIIKFPILRAGIAYLMSGPMWKRIGEDENLNHLRNMLRALRSEYVRHRRLLLRILPKVVDENNQMKNIFLNEGFTWSQDPQKTVIVNLSQSIEEIYKKLRRGWRRSLIAAGKEKLDFIEGTDDAIVEIGLNLVKEMKSRKKFIEFKDMEEIMAVHSDLSEPLKLHIIVCKWNNAPVAVLGWFPVGKIGHPLLGATGDNGIPIKASFPLWWKMITYYKERHFDGCDLAGVNPDRNPGGYIFKTGLAGKDSKQINYLGQYNECENIFILIFFKCAFFIREFYRKFGFNLNYLFRLIKKI